MKKYIILLTIIISPLYALQLTSPAFKDNGMIPEKYTCDGDNISPELEWSGAPEKTQSYALIVEDPDAPGKTWTHWVLFNIPPNVNFLPENATSGPFMNGATDFRGSQEYGGPCPPSGTHRYKFILYALDTVFDRLQVGISKQHLLETMKGHILKTTTLTGKYQSKNKK